MATTKIGTTSSGVGQTYTQPAFNSLNWNTPLNNNFDIINLALGGIQSFTVSNANVTVTAAQAANGLMSLGGTLGADIDFILPAGAVGYTGFYLNVSAIGTYYIRIITSAGGSVGPVISSNGYYFLFNDGTNVNFANTSSIVPPGMITAFAATTIPSGWFKCEGQAISRSVYKQLYDAIGTTWGSGDGSTTFNIPDLRGMFVRGTGTNPTYADAIGPNVGVYQADQFETHTHIQNSHTHAYTAPSSATGLYNSGTSGAQPINIPATTSGTTDPATAVNQNAGSGTETRPQSYGVQYIIKT